MKGSILLIDDSAALAESLASILRMEDYEVTIVNNGLKALSYVQGQTPDLIVTDLVMPEMNGFEFIRRLRRDPRFLTLPIIALSADTRDERAKEGRDAGANLFMTKPFDENILIEAIEKLIRHESR